ncbi:glycoside hydrolase family 27 protein [Hypholoma sublateritium FD-334 SS-4]|uniref:Alpha-galactosidase n=1 Tax=Hypholoma sublateritium (strain FD-334 SS-4) TaxID=945553 RepID=A0A0D2M9N7_HYPSF|nr:glycoside hydrolase family 27 protein [Hypholoma sublateritium FD-334 SS-4]
MPRKRKAAAARIASLEVARDALSAKRRKSVGEQSDGSDGDRVATPLGSDDEHMDTEPDNYAPNDPAIPKIQIHSDVTQQTAFRIAASRDMPRAAPILSRELSYFEWSIVTDPSDIDGAKDSGDGPTPESMDDSDGDHENGPDEIDNIETAGRDFGLHLWLWHKPVHMPNAEGRVGREQRLVKLGTVTTSTISSTTSSTTSTAPSVTLTGIAATAPTTPPSTLTGKLPALGWNAWNAYGCNINETKILAAADQFVSLGLKAVGYEYINIDDCWALMARDATTGRIVPDPTKFPNGLESISTQIHNLGLKMGIYSDAGTNTCAGFPGSLGNEAVDAATFNDWGIDYLKYDNCNVPSNWTDVWDPQGNDWYNSNSAIRYRQMTASWSYITSIISTNVAYLSSVNFFAHNDMDMMEIGNGDLTIQEQRTHFAAWCFLKSPILLGTDMSLLNSTQLAIITNTELLAFHQDATIGIPAIPFTASSSMPSTSPPEYYSGNSTNGVHVFIINTASATATKQFGFANVPGLSISGTFTVHDMWAGADLPGAYAASSTFTVNVAPHDTVAYLIKAA